jgi:O-antigen ligase
VYRVCHELALAAFHDHPAFGLGLEGFRRAWPAYYVPARHDAAYEDDFAELKGVPFDPHSTPLGYLAETGLAALVVLPLVARALWRRRAELPLTVPYLVTLAVASLSIDLLTERTTFLTLGLLSTCKHVGEGAPSR